MKTKIYKYQKNSQFHDYQGIPSLPLKDLNKIIPNFNNKKELNLSVPSFPIMGHMNWIEVAAVIGIVKYSQAKSFLEIGTFDGLIINNVLDNCFNVEEIVTVDLPEKIHKTKGKGAKLFIDYINAEMINTEKIGYRFLKNPRAELVTQIRQDSALLKTSDFSSKFDVILVDGSHTYDYCKIDTELAKKVLNKKGIIIWHDFNKVSALGSVTEYLLTEARRGDLSMYWLRDSEFNACSVVIGLRRKDF